MTKVSDKSSEGKMDVGEASGLMRELAKPVPVKVALYEAAEELKTWTANRVRDVFHADPRVRLDEREQQELRAAAQRKREAAGAAEFRALRERLDRIEAVLRASGADLDLSRDDLGGGDDC